MNKINKENESLKNSTNHINSEQGDQVTEECSMRILELKKSIQKERNSEMKTKLE